MQIEPAEQAFAERYAAGEAQVVWTTLVADLDMGRVREESMTLDVGGHYARRDCFEFSLRPPTSI